MPRPPVNPLRHGPRSCRCARELAGILPLILLPALLAGPAQAQRAAENVVRAADDAFGASVGDESIGLYGPGNVRGFSPVSAGNVRLEGLFVDRQTGFSSRLIAGSTIRAGLSAQGYLLPAPTGIADFSLRRVAESPTQSLILQRNAYGGWTAAADLQARGAGGRLEATGGAGHDRFERGDGTTDIYNSAGGTLRLLPSRTVDVTLFADYQTILQDQLSPRYFPGGSWPLPEVPRRTFVGQPWVEFEGSRFNAGVLAAADVGPARFSAGVFRSAFAQETQTGQFFTDISPDGIGRRLAFLGPPRKSVSDSMEARIARDFERGPRRHRVTLNVRARQRLRRFGGGVEIDLGVGPIDEPAFVERPAVEYGPLAREDVTQLTGGLSYDVRWKGLGQLNLGVQKSDYSRRLADPSAGVLLSKAAPLLYNATANAELRPWLTAYGGVVTGFEESPVAPAIASNRNEAPPAIETRQADAGVRLRVGPMTAVAGVFRIEKPFFGLDEDRFFGERGTITNQGVELSLAGALTRQLQLVFGTLLLNATLDGDAVAEGELSPAPIGALERRTTIDLDYRPRWAPGWSFDLNLASRGEENADTRGEVEIPRRTLVNIGFRRQLSIAGKQLVIRGRLTNLLDEFGWSVSNTGAWSFVGPRALTLSLRADI